MFFSLIKRMKVFLNLLGRFLSRNLISAANTMWFLRYPSVEKKKKTGFQKTRVLFLAYSKISDNGIPRIWRTKLARERDNF